MGMVERLRQNKVQITAMGCPGVSVLCDGAKALSKLGLTLQDSVYLHIYTCRYTYMEPDELLGPAEHPALVLAVVWFRQCAGAQAAHRMLQQRCRGHAQCEVIPVCVWCQTAQSLSALRLGWAGKSIRAAP